MNIRRAKRDFKIIEKYRKNRKSKGARTWKRYHAEKRGPQRFDLWVEDYPFPQHLTPQRATLHVIGEKNLYDPVPGEHRKYFFYDACFLDRLLYVDDSSRLLPRLHRNSKNGEHYLCLHPEHVGPKGSILNLFRMIDLHCSKDNLLS